MKLNLRNGRQSDKVIRERKLSLRLPLGVKIIYIFAAVCLPLYAAFLLSEGFSDFFNRYISSLFRATLAKLTGWIPFSLAEFALLLIPIWVILITRIILKKYGDSAKELISSVVCVFSAFAVAFVVFFIVFGVMSNKLINVMRINRANEKLSSTEEGKKLIKVREYKELYERLLD